MIRHPRATETALGRSRWSSSLRWAGVPTAPLALVLGDVHRLGQLVGKLARLVLADPQPNQIARKTVPARELMQSCPTVEKFFGDLTLELRTETPMSSHGLSSDKPVARSNSSLSGCPVLGVHSTIAHQRGACMDPAFAISSADNLRNLLASPFPRRAPGCGTPHRELAMPTARVRSCWPMLPRRCWARVVL